MGWSVAKCLAYKPSTPPARVNNGAFWRLSTVRRPRHQMVVVGASGFIGTALVQRLMADGRYVTAISRSIGPAWTDRLPTNEATRPGRLTVRSGDVRDRA